MGNEEILYIVPLHEKPNLMQKCIKLLNDEWPRSETARMKSIENSNSNLPISLLLVKTSKESQDEVIGHAKVNRLRHDPGSCWIESVVINPTNRGKGYGKLLMDACEKLGKQLGFSTAILSTHDKQEFYKKLGYENRPPISHYGATMPPCLIANKSCLLTPQGKTNNKAAFSASSVNVNTATLHRETGPTTSIIQTPPQPPPLPKHTNVPHSTKVYMSKSLLVPK